MDCSASESAEEKKHVIIVADTMGYAKRVSHSTGHSGTYSQVLNVLMLTILNKKNLIFVPSRFDHYSAPWH